MAVLVLLSLALFAGSACSLPQASRIVGGEPVSIEEIPSMVQIENLGIWSGVWTQACAGSVLNSMFILTGAFCFFDPFYIPARRRIRAGTANRESGGIISYVQIEFNHETYGESDGSNGDISVVRLITPLVLSDDIRPAPIISHGFEMPDNLPVDLAGWGHTAEGSYSDVLQKTTVFTINRELCAARYLTLPRPDYVTENMICHGILDVGGKGMCTGDVGGPVFYDNIIVGVISWGYVCGSPTFPGVSTKVSSYTDWIIRTAV